MKDGQIYRYKIIYWSQNQEDAVKGKDHEKRIESKIEEKEGLLQDIEHFCSDSF